MTNGARKASGHGRTWAVLFLFCLLFTALTPVAMADGTGGGTPPNSTDEGNATVSSGDGIDAVTTIDTDTVSAVLEKFAIVVQQIL